MPGDVLYSFLRADELAIGAAMPFAPLTDLWLFVPFAPVVGRWSATSGWSMHERDASSRTRKRASQPALPTPCHTARRDH